jgi:hypothetical protein
VGGELDLLVAPFGSAVLAGDQPGPVDPAQVAVDEGIAGLGLVGGALGQPEMPLGIVVPAMRVEERVLGVGPRLDVAPVAVQDVLARGDQLARVGDCGFVDRVGGDDLVLTVAGRR